MTNNKTSQLELEIIIIMIETKILSVLPLPLQLAACLLLGVFENYISESSISALLFSEEPQDRTREDETLLKR